MGTSTENQSSSDIQLERNASSQEEYDTINKYLPDVQKTLNETFTGWYESEQTQDLLNDRGACTNTEPTEWGRVIITDKMGWTSAARSRIEEQVIPKLQSSIPEVSGGMGCKFTFEHYTDIRVPFKCGDGILAWLQSLKGGASDPYKECTKPYEYLYGEGGGD